MYPKNILLFYITVINYSIRLENVGTIDQLNWTLRYDALTR